MCTTSHRLSLGTERAVTRLSSPELASFLAASEAAWFQEDPGRYHQKSPVPRWVQSVLGGTPVADWKWRNRVNRPALPHSLGAAICITSLPLIRLPFLLWKWPAQCPVLMYKELSGLPPWQRASKTWTFLSDTGILIIHGPVGSQLSFC